MTEILSVVARLEVGEATRLRGLAFVPLFADDGAPDADLLEEALAAGTATVTEIDAHGNVGSVLVAHSGARHLLLVDGEEIVGAKQNRMVNASFLVPPGISVEIPVSCVERGRWHYARRDFASSERTVTSSIRARKLSRMVTNLSSSGRRYDADQSSVWEDVDGYLGRTRIRSVTSSFSDAYEARAFDVERLLRQVPTGARQVGIAVVRGTAIVSFDVFGCTSLYRRASKKILRGILADNEDAERVSTEAPGALVALDLEAITRAVFTRTPAPGCGETLHGLARRLAVGAVVHDGRLFHMIAAVAR